LARCCIATGRRARLASSDFPASLYVHVPFCVDKCLYCNFYSVPRRSVSQRLQEEVVEQTIEQAQFFLRALGSVNPPPTVFMGGGTPSSLPRSLLHVLLRSLGAPSSQEWTVEANPESIDEEFLSECSAAGVTRISAGVQSTDDARLQALHRTGSRKDILRAVELLRLHWRADVSLDFIAGIPGQTSQDVVADLSLVDDLAVSHVSLYSLTYEPDTPLARLVQRGDVQPNSAEKDEALWFTGVEELRKRAYLHYEVSNFCRPAKECRHNLRYWRLEPYLGAGPGAVSTLPAEPIAEALGKRQIGREGGVLRMSNPRDLHGFLTGRKTMWGAQFELVSPEDFLLETLMMGLRLEEGVSTKLFRHRFGARLEEILPGLWERWVERGLARPIDDRIALSDSGRMMLDGLLAEIPRPRGGADLRISWP